MGFMKEQLRRIFIKIGAKIRVSRSSGVLRLLKIIKTGLFFSSNCILNAKLHRIPSVNFVKFRISPDRRA